MRIIVRAKGVNLWLPVPLSMAGFAIRRLPEKIFEDMRKEVPEPYTQLITKQNAVIVLEECMDVLKECKGLELVHVEAADGTYVSITV